MIKSISNNILANKKNQLGRSMIEMLGVLAIIGVLSVGGIAGYTKAMAKNKVNKTIAQITRLTQGIRTLYGSQYSYEGLNANILYKAKVLPEQNFQASDSGSSITYSMINPYGGQIIVEESAKENAFGANADKKAFYAVLDKIPTDACIEIVTKNWGKEGIIGTAVNNAALVMFTASSCTPSSRAGAAIFCANGTPVSVAAATDACSSTEQNMIILKMY